MLFTGKAVPAALCSNCPCRHAKASKPGALHCAITSLAATSTCRHSLCLQLRLTRKFNWDQGTPCHIQLQRLHTDKRFVP